MSSLPRSRPRVLVVGPIVLDELVFESGELPRTRRVSGGNAYRFGARLARCGIETSLMGGVGDDDAGRRIVAEARASGVDVSHVAARPSSSTKKAVIDVAIDGGWVNRADPCPAYAYLDRLPADEVLLEHDALHVAGINSLLRSDAAALSRIVDLFRSARRSISVGLNRVSAGQRERLLELLDPMTDPVFGNRAEMEQLAGEASDGADALLASLPFERGVMTLGARGALAREGGSMFRTDGIEMPGVSNTVGAGDVFSAVFSASRWQGGDVPSALAEANAAAARFVGPTAVV